MWKKSELQVSNAGTMFINGWYTEVQTDDIFLWQLLDSYLQESLTELWSSFYCFLAKVFQDSIFKL